MLNKTKSWYSNLTKTGKAILWAATVVLGIGTIGAATSPPPETTPNSTVQGLQTKEPKPQIEVKTQTETQKIPFTKTTINDANLNQGFTQLRTAGVDGLSTKTYEVTYEDGKQKSKSLVSDVVTVAPIAEVTAIGTYVYVPPAPEPSSSCDPNYSPCVPNVSYDLDCPDIGFSVSVIGSDPHGFDRDNDGYGCESY